MVGFLRACTSLSFTVTTQPTPYERHANTERKMGVELVKREREGGREREREREREHECMAETQRRGARQRREGCALKANVLLTVAATFYPWPRDCKIINLRPVKATRHFRRTFASRHLLSPGMLVSFFFFFLFFPKPPPVPIYPESRSGRFIHRTVSGEHSAPGCLGNNSFQ